MKYRLLSTECDVFVELCEVKQDQKELVASNVAVLAKALGLYESLKKMMKVS